VYMGGKVDVAERYIPPVIIDSPKQGCSLTTEETFGPFLYILEVEDVIAAVKYIRERPKPLAAYYFGNPSSEAKDYFLKYTSSGGVTVNDCFMHAASTELPFGGIGPSGSGAVKGMFGFNTLSHMKPILDTDTSNAYPANLRFPPYGPNTVNELVQALSGGAPPENK